MSSTIKIRAHHLLCIQGYQGYGYNDRFKTNLEKVIQLIKTNPDLEVEVVTENDLICDHCPYNIQTGCQRDANSTQKIRAMDLKVLEKLTYQPGIRGKIQNLIRLTNTTFTTRSDIQPICGNCQWKEKCLWFQKFQ